MAFARGGHLSIYVPLRSGGLAQRSCGTSSARVVRGIERLVAQLKDERRWTLLEAVTSKPPRLSLIELYEAEAAKRLEALEASLNSVLLADVRSDWLASVAARLGGSEEERSSVRNYAQQIDTYLELNPGATAADINKASVTAWLASRAGTSTGTRRKYFYAMRSLVGYLFDTGRLTSDPLVRYCPPKKNKARLRWETEENDRLIVRVANPHYRALIAWIKATGADVSSGLRLYRRDLDLSRGATRIPGNKTGRRLVQEATIEPWALPILREYSNQRGLTPGALVWPAPSAESNRKTGRETAEGYTANGVGHHHTAVCERLGITGYTLKDSRHSIAVRMRHKGYEFEDIAAQLGTSVYQVATVYAVFKKLPASRSEVEAAR